MDVPYLRDIFCLLPRWPDHRLLDLAPIAWNKRVNAMTCSRSSIAISSENSRSMSAADPRAFSLKSKGRVSSNGYVQRIPRRMAWAKTARSPGLGHRQRPIKWGIDY